MDKVSPELLHDICACLKIEDVLAFRLVCKVFADVGAAYMLPEVSFYMLQAEFARLRAIADHPIISKHVRSLTYFAEVLDIEKITFPAYVRGHTREQAAARSWNGFFKPTPKLDSADLPKLRSDYQTYELTMKQQQEIIDHAYDVECLKEVIPKFSSLRQASVSSTGAFYDDNTKSRTWDATRPLELCKSRKSPFESIPLSSGNSLLPEGKRHLNGLIAGLVATKTQLEGFRAGVLDWSYFKDFLEIPDGLSHTFKYLKRLELFLDTDPGQDSRGITRCRKALRSGILKQIIKPLQQLEVLMITLYPVEWTSDEWPASLGDIIAPGHTWPALRVVSLGGIKTNRHDLIKFLELHKDTLKKLCMRDLGLGETSWWKLLPDLRNKLELSDVCICGDIIGKSEGDADGVPDEFWDLATEEDYPHHKQRASINAYCLGPKHYPDNVPLSKEVVREHYEEYINDPEASCDEDDFDDDDEVYFDGPYAEDYLDFYGDEDFLGGFDDEEDMDLVSQMLFAGAGGAMFGFGAPVGFDDEEEEGDEEDEEDEDDDEIPDLIDPDS
ncbi:hypothetical protein PFICI_05602 [Pestalotiopsis fici W106-1]|uniref:F-box domain-containing protein n=1 Tax=Pestalotiopsis fici (strain W106-1 / CGMCC3.15140) TaxID=1229662 RepID=W3XEX8_PESFW|nr:uncharacterized protein PFICI_05602 [Pestalotiopsis fici W106-1]ETS83726.1 hypothetical protein PFICI_05602 [Pestalotiopsis fici W106-1]